MPETTLACRLKRRFRRIFARNGIDGNARMEQSLRAPYFLTGQIAAPAGIQRDVRVEMSVMDIAIHLSRQSLGLQDGVLSGFVDLLRGRTGRVDIWLGHGNKEVYGADIQSSHAWRVSIDTKGTILIKVISGDSEEVTRLSVLEEGALQVVSQTVTTPSQSMELHDIYGQPSASSHSDSSIGSSGSSGSGECIACLSNSKDTVVLPCRHMCLCSGCAEGVRSRTDGCPLCRRHFTGFLYLSNVSLPLCDDA